VREDRTAFDGRATIKEVTITFGPPQLPPIRLMLIIPNDRRGPAPVILGMNYFGNHTLVRSPAVPLSTNWMPERGEGVVNNRSTEASRGTWVDIWQIEKMIARGYAVATFYNGDIDPDRPDQRGIQMNFGKTDPKYECGTIAAWAWGLQRAVDYLVTDSDLDRNRIIVTGHSRTGKAALLAAASMNALLSPFRIKLAAVAPPQAAPWPTLRKSRPGSKSPRRSNRSTTSSPTGSTRGSKNLTISLIDCHATSIVWSHCALPGRFCSVMAAWTLGLTRRVNSRCCAPQRPFTGFWGPEISLPHNCRPTANWLTAPWAISFGQAAIR
jgi:hypothetical protein